MMCLAVTSLQILLYSIGIKLVMKYMSTLELTFKTIFIRVFIIMFLVEIFLITLVELIFLLPEEYLYFVKYDLLYFVKYGGVAFRMFLLYWILIDKFSKRFNFMAMVVIFLLYLAINVINMSFRYLMLDRIDPCSFPMNFFAGFISAVLNHILF